MLEQGALEPAGQQDLIMVRGRLHVTRQGVCIGGDVCVSFLQHCRKSNSVGCSLGALLQQRCGHAAG